MSEAGQIFAMLRSSSAAEIAKRFNSMAEGGSLMPQGALPETQSNGPAASATATQAGTSAKGAAWAATVQTPTPLPGASSPVADAATLPEAPGQSQTGPLRSVVSLGHLAPPKAELARQLAESLLSSLPKQGSAASATATGVAAQLGALGDGQGSLGNLVAGTAGEAGDTPLPTSGPMQQGADAAARARTAGATDRPVGPDISNSRAALTAETAKSGDEAAGLRAAIAGLAQALGESTTTTATAKAALTTQIAVFAEAVTTMLAAPDPGRAGSIASGVILNAAMIPGWPFPAAQMRDQGETINTKALLHQLAAAVERMSPQQAAEYMAKVAGGHILLRTLRKILKELDLIEKDEVKGLLFAFLETLSTIASGIQTALKQMTEQAAVQAAVVHGEDPEDGDRPGRRRLRL